MSKGSDWRSVELRKNPLRQEREKFGTPEEVGKLLGLTGRTIYRYESGEQPAPAWYRLALIGLKSERRKA